MKKLLLLIAAIGGLAVNLWATKVSYGPKIGANFSFLKNLDKLPLPKKSSVQANVFDVARTSLHWGAYFEYNLHKKWSIGTELVYSYVGSIYKKLGLKLSYINMPVWFMYYPLGIQRGLGLYLGPTLNFLWHATPQNLVIIEERYVAPFEWAIIGGLRYLWDFGLSIDLRYNWGLTDVFDFHPDPEKLRPRQLRGVKLTNHCLQLSLGYNLAPLIHNQR